MEDHYPLPPNPDVRQEPNGKAGAGKGAAGGKGRRRKRESVQEVLKGRKRTRQKAGACNGTTAAGESSHGDADIGALLEMH